MTWCEQTETKIQGEWLKGEFSNIFVGSCPKDGATQPWASQFDCIINVSDTEGVLFEPAFKGQRTYWYPLNENGEWSYCYFYMIFKILDFHYSKGHKIYVHCRAGIYRSPSILKWWLVASQNKKLHDAYDIVSNSPKPVLERSKSQINFALYQNYYNGNLPPNFQTFIRRYSRSKNYLNCVLINGNPISNRFELETSYIKTLKKITLKKLLLNIKSIIGEISSFIKYKRMGYKKIKLGLAATLYETDWEKRAKKVKNDR